MIDKVPQGRRFNPFLIVHLLKESQWGRSKGSGQFSSSSLNTTEECIKFQSTPLRNDPILGKHTWQRND